MEYYLGSIVLPYFNNFNMHVFYIVTLLIEMDIAVIIIKTKTKTKSSMI